MQWNKEKIVFALSLVVLVLTAITTIRAWTTASDSLPSVVRPRETGDVNPSTVEKIDWFAVSATGVGLRNPFGTVSSWREPEPDPLPMPPTSSLVRRVPLPAPLAHAERARPPRELSPPEIEEGR